MSSIVRILLCSTAILCSVHLSAGTGPTISEITEPAEATKPAGAAIEARPFFFALSVQDMERSTQWYQRIFGFEVVRSVELEQRGLRIRLLRRDGGFLELVEAADARALDEIEPKLGKRHLLHGLFKVGFVVDNLNITAARLEAFKVPLRGEVVTEADNSMRSLQVEDPDGNVIQVFEVLKRD